MEQFYAIRESTQNLPEDLESLSKEELVGILKNIRNAFNDVPQADKIHAKKKKEKGNPFDFKKYKKIHVALKILYLGWDYAGFAVQDNTEETIEAHLFKAFLKTKLIDARETSNYHRYGRTDKGVLAFSQVVSLDLRTNLLEGPGVFTPENYDPSEKKGSDKELDYVTIMNRVLPLDIRVIAWAPVEPSFSARFDCLQRTYKYWFPKSDLNIEKMQDAAHKLIGEHDFRNFCKMDVGNGVVQFIRKILKAEIMPVALTGSGAYEMFELTIVGSSFLWHQIRCIVTVLVLIGQGKEDPEVLSQLLDVTRFPQKPQYSMASEIPLVLFDCSYENMQWIYSEENLRIVIRQMQEIWTKQSIKTAIIKRMLEELGKACASEASVFNQAESLLNGVRSRLYKRLLERPLCDSLEDRIAHYKKKQKLNSKTENQDSETVSEIVK